MSSTRSIELPDKARSIHNASLESPRPLIRRGVSRLSSLQADGFSYSATTPKPFITRGFNWCSTLASTGTELWRFESDWSCSCSPIITGDRIYIGFEPILCAFDLGGGELWRTMLGEKPGGRISPIANGDGIVAVTASDGYLYAIDGKTGTVLWRRFLASEWYSPHAEIFAPLVSDGVIYVGAYLGETCALDALTGELRWRNWIRRGFESSLTLSLGHLYASCYPCWIYRFNTETGERDSLALTKDHVRATPAVAGDTVYYSCNDHYVYAIDWETGESKWRFETGSPVWSSPVVHNAFVYVGSTDTNLYALNAVTGEEVWRFKTSGMIWSPPKVHQDIVYLGSEDSHLYALDGGSGAELWRFGAESGLLYSPAVTHGMVVVGDEKHTFYAIACR